MSNENTNIQTTPKVPAHVGLKRLEGSHYVAECTRCCWIGSSAELTEDAQCTRIEGGSVCLGDTNEVGADHLLGIIQVMSRPVALHRDEAVAAKVIAYEDEIRDARDYAIEHAGYLADAADQVMADYQAYALAQMLKAEGGDDGDGELENAVDSARDELHEGLANLRSMTHEFRKRRSRAGKAVGAESNATPDPLGCNACTHPECGKFDGPQHVECRAMADNACARPSVAELEEPTDIDPRECRKCGSFTVDECKAGGCWFERDSSDQACGYANGDWQCRPGGYLYDAGTGEGHDPQDCSHICPCCRTKDYLEAAKDDAESTSKYSNNLDSGTGLDIWKSAEREALKANHPAAVKALAEIGPVQALDDETVVICNSQGAPVGEVKP